jgi:hypothetical protein
LIASDRFETGLQRRACLSRRSEKAQEANVTSNEDRPSIAWLPAAIAAALAAIGVAGMIFVFVSAEQIPEGNVGMLSTDAVSRAGATITPTPPDSVRPSGSTVAARDLRKDL